MANPLSVALLALADHANDDRVSVPLRAAAEWVNGEDLRDDIDHEGAAPVEGAPVAESAPEQVPAEHLAGADVPPAV